jgi:hypothetical protein
MDSRKSKKIISCKEYFDFRPEIGVTRKGSTAIRIDHRFDSGYSTLFYRKRE